MFCNLIPFLALGLGALTLLSLGVWAIVHFSKGGP